jgi:hypothetical protein
MNRLVKAAGWAAIGWAVIGVLLVAWIGSEFGAIQLDGEPLVFDLLHPLDGIIAVAGALLALLIAVVVVLFVVPLAVLLPLAIVGLVLLAVAGLVLLGVAGVTAVAFSPLLLLVGGAWLIWRLAARAGRAHESDKAVVAGATMAR